MSSTLRTTSDSAQHQLKAMKHYRDPPKDDDDGDDDQDDADKHWIQKLFPPTYYFKHEQIDDKTHVEPKGILGAKISQFDAEKMREIYQRVHALYMFEEEFEKAKKAEEEGVPHDLSKEIAELEKVDKKEPEEIDIEDSTLWDDKEIGVLRSVFKEAKRQNRKLQVVLEVKLRQLWSIEKRYKEHADVLRKTTQELNEAKIANQRQEILINNLHDHLKCERKRSSALTDENKGLNIEHVDLNDHIQMLRIDLNHEKHERKRRELELDEQNQEASREQFLREEKVKLLHEEEVVKLHERIQVLEEELAKEKQDHATTKRGLDHLRTHFANLPIAGHGNERLKKVDLF